jgi:hypothetical protein
VRSLARLDQVPSQGGNELGADVGGGHGEGSGFSFGGVRRYARISLKFFWRPILAASACEIKLCGENHASPIMRIVV